MKSPLKFSLKTELFPLAVVALAIVVSIWSYPLLPNQVVSHWNFAGQADDWSSKNFHAIFFPGLLIGMYLLFSILPFIDPKKERYADFAKVYFFFRAAMILVVFAIFMIATLINLGYPININKTMPWIIGLLMIFIGYYLSRIKMNWFIGIRTPWTLSSENVWNKTHRLGGWLFILFGLTLFIEPYLTYPVNMIVFVITIILVTIVPFAYSYVIFRKEKNGEK